MALSYADLEGLWIQAGGSPAVAPVAAAIALAESGGNPNAHNGNSGTGDDSYGLWQINMIGGMGPSRRSQFGIGSNTQLFDPLTNAKAAVMVSGGGTSFGPWTTFTHGTYKQYLNDNVPPNLTAGGAGGAPPTATQASLSSDTAAAFAPMFNLFGNVVVLGAALVGGGIVVAAGLYMLFKGTDVTGIGSAASAVRVVGGPAAGAALRAGKATTTLGKRKAG